VEMGQLSLMAVAKVAITPGTVAGIELATPGVSSPGFEKYFPGVTGLDSLFEAYTKDLRYANLQDRGFLDLNISKTQITAGFEYLKGVDPSNNQPIWERDTLITGANNTFKELPGFNTPLLKARVPGLNISEVFTIGEAIGNYIPTGTPDGMGAYLKDANTIRLLVQSEITKTSGYAYKLANGTELTGARIHYLDIDKASSQVIGAGLAYSKVFDRAGKEVTAAKQISGDASGNAGYDRFCAANLIEANAFGAGKGFVDRIHLLGEESSSANNNLGGTMVALDVASGTLYAVPDLGFGTWEAATVLDTGNTNQVALLLGDDFASATIGAPIYLYVGTKSTAAGASFLERNGLKDGKLYAWVADQGAALNRPSEFKGYGATANGKWVEIATKDASKAGSTGYDALGYKSAALLRADADSKNAFLGARIEDLDVNPNKTNQAVFVATGNETFDGGSDLLGTVYTLDVSFSSAGAPTAGTLKIVYDGDDAGNGPNGLRSPDNLAVSKDGFAYIQEDKAVYGGDADVKYGLEKSSIWKLDLSSGKAIRWAQIDDSIDPDGSGGQALDKNDAGYKAYGWESSGIIDVSNLYGNAPGTDFFANIQTHGVKGGAIADFNLAAGGQIVKLTESGSSASKPMKLEGLPDLNSFSTSADGMFLILSGQKDLNGGLYPLASLPSTGALGISFSGGGAALDFPTAKGSRNITIQLDAQPGDPEVNTQALVADVGGALETISNAGRGLISGVISNYVHTRDGKDTITGSSGVDFIRAGADDDLIDAGAGKDLVRSGTGNDRVTLGAGADKLLITRDQLAGKDTLLDFSSEDSLVLSDGITVLSGLGTNTLKVGLASGSFQELVLAGSSLPSWNTGMITSI